MRVSEDVCPFCGATLSAELRASPAPLGPAARLSRAALVAFGAGALGAGTVATSGCADTNPIFAYGAAIVEDAGGPLDAQAPDANVADAAPPSDATTETDASGGADASEDAPQQLVDAADGAAPVNDD